MLKRYVEWVKSALSFHVTWCGGTTGEWRYSSLQSIPCLFYGEMGHDLERYASGAARLGSCSFAA